jgi:O-antigen ligase
VGQAATQPLNYRRAPQATAAAAPLPATAPQGALTGQAFGLTVLTAFIFMIFSRVFDMHLGSLHIPGIAERILLAVVVLSGTLWRPFQTTIGKRLLAFTVWMILGVPFSVWRSNSLAFLLHPVGGVWWPCMVVFVAVAGLIENYQQYRRIAWTMAISIFVLSLFCLHYGTMETGRLFMANSSRFSNPNEMAQAMLIGIPFWLAIFKRAHSPVHKLLAAIVVIVMAYIIAKTGSRGALISFAVLYLAMLYHASAIGKAGLLLVASLSVCAALAFLPSSLKDRYKTLFSEDKPQVENVGEDTLLDSAVSSTESRQQLLRQSLILTATHPIFGVGVGQFPVAENTLAISQGKRRGSWLGTHNAYTQVASETGLPGLFLFVSVLSMSLNLNRSLYNATKDRPELREISTHAEALFLSLICLAITDVFIHAAYTMLLPVLAGMSLSLEYATRSMMTRAERSKIAAPIPCTTVRRVFPGRVASAGTASMLPGA